MKCEPQNIQCRMSNFEGKTLVSRLRDSIFFRHSAFDWGFARSERKERLPHTQSDRSETVEPQTVERKAGVLIINADDLGKNEITTQRILQCHRQGRITSASAMVFMSDSERAADLALQTSLDVGLHLNFTQAFTGLRHYPRLENAHASITGFLARTKRVPLYHPLLRRHYEVVCHAQMEEFLRLYGMKPSHVDGHEHMHLCGNMIMHSFIPQDYPVRRSFHFFKDEKTAANRLYRRLLNGWVSRHFPSTDYFFDVEPMDDERILRILALSRTSKVELMVHPERDSQLAYLLSDRFHAVLRRAHAGTWKDVGPERKVQGER